MGSLRTTRRGIQRSTLSRSPLTSLLPLVRAALLSPLL
jgi:hypothetical protein